MQRACAQILGPSVRCHTQAGAPCKPSSPEPFPGWQCHYTVASCFTTCRARDPDRVSADTHTEPVTTAWQRALACLFLIFSARSTRRRRNGVRRISACASGEPCRRIAGTTVRRVARTAPKAPRHGNGTWTGTGQPSGRARSFPSSRHPLPNRRLRLHGVAQMPRHRCHPPGHAPRAWHWFLAASAGKRHGPRPKRNRM